MMHLLAVNFFPLVVITVTWDPASEMEATGEFKWIFSTLMSRAMPFGICPAPIC